MPFLTRRRVADLFAAAFLVLLLIFGLSYVSGDAPIFSPSFATSGPSASSAPAPTPLASPGASPAPSPAAAAAPSALDRALTDRFLHLLRAGLVVLGAFVVAGVAHRAVLGDFSGKFGPLELGQVSQAGREADKELLQKLEDLQQETGLALEGLERVSQQLLEQSHRADVNLAEELEGLRERVATVTNRLDELEADSA